jgi:hypothetical protein
MVTLRAKKQYRSESWSRFVLKGNIDQNYGHTFLAKAHRSESWSYFVRKHPKIAKSATSYLTSTAVMALP